MTKDKARWGARRARGVQAGLRGRAGAGAPVAGWRHGRAGAGRVRTRGAGGRRTAGREARRQLGGRQRRAGRPGRAQQGRNRRAAWALGARPGPWARGLGVRAGLGLCTRCTRPIFDLF